MDKNSVLHILRNQYGHPEEEIRAAGIEACDLIEKSLPKTEDLAVVAAVMETSGYPVAKAAWNRIVLSLEKQCG